MSRAGPLTVSGWRAGLSVPLEGRRPRDTAAWKSSQGFEQRVITLQLAGAPGSASQSVGFQHLALARGERTWKSTLENEVSGYGDKDTEL